MIAQLQLTAPFNFGNPLSLSPSITPGDYTGAKIVVSDKTFTFGNISIGFSIGAGSGGSAQIMTTINPYTGEVSYCLRITQGCLMTISGTNGATLNTISFDDNSLKGDLSLQFGQPGSFSGMTWTSGGNSVSSVAFLNTGEASQLKVITVNYTDLQDVLTPSSSVTEGAELTSFKNMTLAFASAMTQVSTSGIKIEGTGISGSKALQTSLSGNVVTLSLPDNEEITTDGAFKITVPAGSFRDGQGYQNKDLVYNFTVREPRNTFDPIAISPENGSTLEILEFPIILTFPTQEDNYIGYVDNSKIFFLNREGVSSPIAQVKAEQGTEGQVLLQVQGAVTSFATGGVYTLSIDEKTVFNQMHGTDYAHYNNQIDLSYTVVEPVDPLKDLKEEAANLLEQIGSEIGYPAAGSNADQQLSAVTADGATPTKEELEDAIAAFYSETNVVMPTEGNWYNIIGVNANNQNAYVAYADGKTSVSSASDAAAPFQFTKNSDGTYSFKTADGKYIMILSESGKVVETISKSSRLSVSKQLVIGVDNKLLLGKFSLNGWLGNDDEGTDLGYSTAAINYTNFTVVTPPTTGYSFNNTTSSAFIFQETTDPGLPDAVDPELSLSPTSITSNTQTLTIIFSNVTSVGLKDANKPFFSTDAAGQDAVTTATAENILTKSGANTFTVHPDGLANGNYYLQLPVGTFDYSESGVPVNDVAKALSFSIVEPQSQFNTSYTLYNALQVIERNIHYIDYIRDVDLNDLVFMARVPSFYSDLIPNPNVIVKIKNYYTSVVVTTGHFEAYTNFATDYPAYAADGYKAIKLVLPDPIQAGQLNNSPDLYCYDIPEAAFGDAKYGQYLVGQSGVRQEDCIVNPRTEAPYFYVDNSRATAITGIHADRNVEQKIYDLNGRRVMTPTKGGVYIINGKKVVMK